MRVGALMRMMGALEAKGGWCFQGKHGRWGRLPAGRRTDEVDCRLDSAETKRRMPRNRVAGSERRVCSEILCGGTPLEELQLRPGWGRV